jgi:hypothetical protein
MTDQAMSPHLRTLAPQQLHIAWNELFDHLVCAAEPRAAD